MYLFWKHTQSLVLAYALEWPLSAKINGFVEIKHFEKINWWGKLNDSDVNGSKYQEMSKYLPCEIQTDFDRRFWLRNLASKSLEFWKCISVFLNYVYGIIPVHRNDNGKITTSQQDANILSKYLNKTYNLCANEYNRYEIMLIINVWRYVCLFNSRYFLTEA